MKSIVLALTLLSILLSSCNKGEPPVARLPTGTFAFRSVTYTLTTCTVDTGDASVTVAGQSEFDNCTISFNFLNGYPATGSNFTVLPGTTTMTTFANQVTIHASAGGSSYYSAGEGQSLVVDIIKGKTQLSGNGIEMLNTGNASDSSALSFNITQTN